MDTEIQVSLKQIASFIQRCKKMQPKFKEGSAQFTLLKNRIQALEVAHTLLSENGVQFSLALLEATQAPLASIHQKCTKAQAKYDSHASGYQRYVPMILAMHIAQMRIHKEIQFISEKQNHDILDTSKLDI